MKKLVLAAVSFAALILARAEANVIYSGLKDIVIPTDFVGVYLDVDTGIIGTDDNSPPGGWDINPFFSGAGVANSPSFQPARTGTGTTDRIIALSAGEAVSNALPFSTGYGGSEDHLGTEYSTGAEAYLAFKSTTTGPSAAGPYFGWMRVIFTAATSGAFIKDWAYDDAGTPIIAGRVHQGSPLNGTQLVTLSPGGNESFTLVSVLSDTSGNVNSVLKTGAGTTVLIGANTYSGSTTIEGGILSIGASENLGNGSATNIISISNGTLRSSGSGVSLGANRALAIGPGGASIEVTAGNDLTFSGVITTTGSFLTKLGLGTLVLDSAVGDGTATVNANAGITQFGASQSLAALNIAAGAVVTLADPAAASEPITSAGQAVPEPDSISALLAGTLALIGQRRRKRRAGSFS